MPEAQSGSLRGLKRGAWRALLGVAAVAATFAQFDQQSRSNTGLALLVPRPFRSQAAMQLTMLSLDIGNGQALSEAETLLRHSPVPAESLTLYGIAANASGKPDLASRAVAAAAARGWREPIAQEAVFAAAMSAGNYQVALDRLVALWRIGIRDERIVGLFQRLAGEEDGRKAFVQRLRVDDAWREGFISWGRSHLRPQEFAQILSTGMAGSLAVECDELSDAASSLLRAGDLRAAEQIWTGKCAGSSGPISSTSAKFGFQPQGASAAPAKWFYPDSFGLTRTLHGAEGKTTMTASNSEPLPAIVADRYAAIKPGHYTLAVRTQQADGNRALVRVEVSCVRPGGELSRVIQTSGSGGTSTFFIPEGECAVQRYRVYLKRGSLDDFDLELRAG